MDRREVYKILDEERDYQDNMSDGDLTVGDEILLAIEYIERARKEWTKDFNPPEMVALGMLRKVAAICIRAMEHHGVPKGNR